MHMTVHVNKVQLFQFACNLSGWKSHVNTDEMKWLFS